MSLSGGRGSRGRDLRIIFTKDHASSISAVYFLLMGEATENVSLAENPTEFPAPTPLYVTVSSDDYLLGE